MRQVKSTQETQEALERINKKKSEVGTFQLALPRYATMQTRHNRVSARGLFGEGESDRVKGHIRVGT